MPNPNFPVLNGIAPSWADIKVDCKIYEGALFNMADIKAVNRTRTVEVGTVQGASGGRPMRRTTGAVTYDASLTFYREGFDQFLRNAISVAPTRGTECLLSLVHFDITILHTPPGSTKIFEYVLEGCRSIGDTIGDAEGTDAEEVEVPLSVIQIVDIIDGKRVVML
jgi:hypothetical protein